MFCAQQKNFDCTAKETLQWILRVGRIGACRGVFTKGAVRRCSSK